MTTRLWTVMPGVKALLRLLEGAVSLRFSLSCLLLRPEMISERVVLVMLEEGSVCSGSPSPQTAYATVRVFPSKIQQP